MSVAEPSPTERHCTWVVFDDYEYSVHSDSTSFYDNMVGDVYCDIDDAIRRMQDICAKACMITKKRAVRLIFWNVLNFGN